MSQPSSLQLNHARRERLYALLPALYRQMDALQGEPLRALTQILEAELQHLEDDTAALYDNWFIESCDRWVIPYIAELVGVRDLKDVQQQWMPGQRRHIANTIAYRRRKGTVATLEHVLCDVTDWDVYAVETAQHLGMNQHLGRIRSDKGASVRIGGTTETPFINSPFTLSAYTYDVRSAPPLDTPPTSARWNLPGIDLYIWRVRPFTVSASPAAHYSGDGYYTFDRLGRDVPLFNAPQEVGAIERKREIEHLPIRLTRAIFAAHLASYTATAPQHRPANSRFYGEERGLWVAYWATDPLTRRPVLQGVPPERVVSRALGDGLRDSGHQPQPLPKDVRVAIDVERGRVAFLSEENRPIVGAHPPVVRYTYGGSAAIGGGSYEGRADFGALPDATLHIYVAKGIKESVVSTFYADGLAAGRWHGYAQSFKTACALVSAFYRKTVKTNAPTPATVVHFLDNGVYKEAAGDIHLALPRDAEITIAAADGVQPVLALHGTVEIECLARARFARADCHVSFNGLAIVGTLHLGLKSAAQPSGADHTAIALSLAHCTIMPGGVEVEVRGTQTDVRLSIGHSIVGPLRLAAAMRAVTIDDCIVDNACAPLRFEEVHRGPALVAPTYALCDRNGDFAPPLTLRRVTVFGDVATQQVYAYDSLFTGGIATDSTMYSSLHYCAFPPDITITHSEHCFQDVDMSNAAALFESIRFGDPQYAQLSHTCPARIVAGASDGGEMGAFNSLHQPQRRANISPILDEYLPYGLEASLYYVT